MADVGGLLSGLGKALGAGVDTYQKQEKADRDYELKKMYYEYLMNKNKSGKDLTANQLLGRELQVKKMTMGEGKLLEDPESLSGYKMTGRVFGGSNVVPGAGAGGFLSTSQQEQMGKKPEIVEIKDDSGRPTGTFMPTGGYTEDYNSKYWKDKALGIHKEVVNKIKSDPLSWRMTAAYHTLDRSLGNFLMDPTVAQYHELQQAIRTTSTAVGRTTGAEREKDYIDSLANKVNVWWNYVKNNAPRMKQTDLSSHVTDLAKNDMDIIKSEYKKRLGFLSGGHDYIYDKPEFKHLKDSLDSLAGSAVNQFSYSPQTGGYLKKSEKGQAKSKSDRVNKARELFKKL